jgi:type I restriction enzyme S subunit
MLTVAGVGGSLVRARPQAVKSILIALPPLPEQKRIAAILDQADDVRRKRQAVASKLERLRQASLDEACRLSTRSVPLSSLFIDIKMGPFGSLLHKADYVVDGVPLINPMHISRGRILPDPAFSVSESKAQALSGYRLEADDIVIGRRGEMGRSALVLPEHAGMLCGTGSMRLRVDRNLSSPEFVADFLSHPRTVRELENAASGVTMLNLSSKSFDKIMMRFPPLDAQATYAKTKAEIAEKRKALEVGMALADTLFASLQHRAFRGEL